MRDLKPEKSDGMEEVVENSRQPIVLDSYIVLSKLKKVLSKLCASLEVLFDEAMLHWEAGAIPEDGTWAKYWYHSVWKSTGWGESDRRERELPPRLDGCTRRRLCIMRN